jgi:hypothetical protein
MSPTIAECLEHARQCEWYAARTGYEKGPRVSPSKGEGLEEARYQERARNSSGCENRCIGPCFPRRCYLGIKLKPEPRRP